MRTLGDILLLSCYELGHQPWNLASPLALLEAAGLRPMAIDTAVSPLPAEVIEKAQIVAISVPMHTALRLGTQVATRVRRLNAKAHITFYGLYAWLNREYLLSTDADSVIAGEYEAPLLALVQALEAGNPLENIRGVGSAKNQTTPHMERLTFSVPNRRSLPALEQYAHFQLGTQLSLAGYVETTRGCLHTCLHCPITPVYQGRFFVIPREIVLADIRTQVAAGARHITFGDPDFLNGPGHVMKILRAMHDEFPFLTFDVTIKIEHILEKRFLFPELRRLGCAFVVSAVESFSELVLQALDKGHSAAEIEEAITIVEAAGITLRPTFVAFTPWTTLNDYLEMLQAIEALNLVSKVDPVQYTIRLLVPPGSALLNDPENHHWLGTLDSAAFTYRWEHPDSRMDRLHQEIVLLVEEMLAPEESTLAIFQHIKALVCHHAGLSPPPLPSQAQDDMTRREAIPGLTESWFC